MEVSSVYQAMREKEEYMVKKVQPSEKEQALNAYKREATERKPEFNMKGHVDMTV
jgi:hypothetical protein